MGGTIDFIMRDGSRLTPWMLYIINRANAEFKAKFGCELLVTSGIRLYEEQKAIFLSKYRVQWVGSGPFGDVRWWQGRRYVRHVGGGTVAAPDKSNHIIQGSGASAKGAVDLRDSGRDAGVSKGNNPRADWLRANASRLGLIASGYEFGEPWHYDIPGIYRTPPAAPAGSNSKPLIIPSEEDSMFIAIVKKKDWYLVTGGKACLLGAASGARGSGAPILEFVDDWAVKQLKTIVTGIK